MIRFKTQTPHEEIHARTVQFHAAISNLPGFASAQYVRDQSGDHLAILGWRDGQSRDAALAAIAAQLQAESDLDQVVVTPCHSVLRVHGD